MKNAVKIDAAPDGANQHQATGSSCQSVSVSMTDGHYMAVRMLAQPTPSPFTLAILRSAPADVVPFLWQTQAAASVSPESFLDAVQRFESLDGANLPSPGDELVHNALSILGYAWRALNPSALRQMVLQCMPPVARLNFLEVKHVLTWLLHHADDQLPELSFKEMLDSAMAWQYHDEIMLHKRPFRWPHAVGDVAHEVFRLVPLESTAQLLEQAENHQGQLCRMQLAEACSAGLEAWWLAYPKFSPPGWDPRPCAVGLSRPNVDSEWVEGHHAATPGWTGHAQSLANAVLLRANDARRLQNLHALAGDLASAPAGLLEAMRNALNLKAASVTVDEAGSVVPAELFGQVWRHPTLDDVLADSCVRIILDTNVLLSRQTLERIHQALEKQGGDAAQKRLVLPGCVLDELEKIQLSQENLPAKVKAARRFIENWLDLGWLEIPASTLKPARAHADPIIAKLAATMCLQAEVAVLTYDRDLRIRLKTSGLPVLVPTLDVQQR